MNRPKPDPHDVPRDQESDAPGPEGERAGAEGDQPRGPERAPQESSPVAEASLREQLEAALADRDAHYERLLRTMAEFDNYRKRSQREAEQLQRYQALPLIRDLLPVLDNLKRAVEAAEGSGEAADLVQGVKMVARQMEDVLASYSAEPIEAAGQPFDPHLHEAVQQMPSADHPPMTVLHELERGYRLHDRVVRPSKVVVSSAPPQESG